MSEFIALLKKFQLPYEYLTGPELEKLAVRSSLYVGVKINSYPFEGPHFEVWVFERDSGRFFAKVNL